LDADEYLAPMRWLLERAGAAHGLPPTGAHHVDHTVIVEAHGCVG
jgi:hypothetical protein